MMRDSIRAALREAREDLAGLAERLLRFGYDQSEVMEEILYDLLDRVPAAAARIDAATDTGPLEPIDQELIQFALEGILRVALRRIQGRRTLGDVLRERRGGSARPLSSGT